MRLHRNAIVKLVGVCLGLGAIHPAQAQKMIGQVKTFPIVISKSGSYKLRSNIVVPDANTTAISVTADNVTIDLNGFSILGPVVCSGGPPVTSCTPTASGSGGYGIDSRTAGVAGTTVLNGSVQGLGKTGLYLGPRARVKDVQVVSNGFYGIDAGGQATITVSTALNNGIEGIAAQDAALVSGDVIFGNGGDGVAVWSGTVTGNDARRNGNNGIQTGDGVVIGNSALLNGGFGLGAFGGEVGYTNNVFRGNTFGTVNGGGTDMGHNDCNGSTTCP